MECADDSRITFLAVKCAAQSSKTQTVLNLLCHTIAEDPGPTMYVMANNDDAEDFVRDRVSPMFAACKPVGVLHVQRPPRGRRAAHPDLG